MASSGVDREAQRGERAEARLRLAERRGRLLGLELADHPADGRVGFLVEELVGGELLEADDRRAARGVSQHPFLGESEPEGGVELLERPVGCIAAAAPGPAPSLARLRRDLAL